MGSGIVFTYLLIVAVVAPIVWLAWWMVDSLGNARRIPAVAAPRRSTVKAAAPAHPYPVDLVLPAQAGKVIRYSTSGKALASCPGPDAGGECPFKSDEGVVPCSGTLLALPRAIRGSFEWQIPAGYRSCLLGSYGAFRRTDSAG